jgi:uncharacterized membrane protein YsdA (DUF1294 family)
MGGETIRCVDCGRTFIWSHREQRFYKERGLAAPKRCRECRALRRREGDSGARGLVTRRGETTSARQKQRGASQSVRPPVGHKTRGSGKSRSPSDLLDLLSWRVGPVYSFGLVAFAVAIVAMSIIWWGLPLDVLQSWLLSISFVTLLAYGYDKLVSKLNDELDWGWTRVPERVLLALTFFGGTVGAILGRLAFHHKTSKTSFHLKFWLVVALQIVVIIAFYMLLKPWIETTMLPRIGW